MVSIAIKYVYAYGRHMRTNISDVRPYHRIAVLHSIALVDSVQTSDLHAPTPCVDWNLAELLAHMTAQHRGFAAAARGSGASPDVWRADAVMGAVTVDPGGTYADAARDVLVAFADDAVLRAPFALPEFGPKATFPGAIAIGFHFVDYVVHGWDVAEALGVAYSLPDDVVEAALPLALSVPDGDYRKTADAPFAPAVEAPSSTNRDRILRHLGRTPGWVQGQSRLAN
jgi:uncharacterized protein (TIGR03086 family)